ncbi:hypothetical protein LCGC14_1957270, partial [marine sediment metagenome]
INMQFNKKVKVGVFLLCLLLIFTTGISLIDIDKQNNVVDKNLLSLSGMEDDYEIWNNLYNNNEKANATDIRLYKANWLSIIAAGVGNQSDQDWYRINASAGQHIKVMLNHNYSSGMMNIELWNNTNILIGNYNGIDNKTLDYDVTIGGDYYINVSGNDLGYTYDLRWDTGLALVPDIYEPNNNFSSAWSLMPNLYTDLTILGGDNDWFRLENITYFDFLNITIFFNHSEGDLQLELYNPSNGLQALSNSTSDNEQILFNATDPGAWRIRVYHMYGNSDVNYTLDILVNAGVLGDDIFEPNDDFSNARSINSGYYANLQIAGGNEDWFKVPLIVGDIISVNIYFNHSYGDLGLELYDGSNIWQTGNYSSTNDEYIWYNVTFSGDWRIRVYHAFGNSIVDYDLYIWVDSVDDSYEENDYDWEAKSITSMKDSWITNLRQKDNDWYYFNLDSGKDRIFVQLKFSHASGDIDITLQNSSYEIGWGYSVDDNEHFDVNVPTWGGLYYIRVFGYGNISTQNTYDLYWSDSGFADDNYEPNDDYLNATDITTNENSWLPFGPGIQWDDDWYKIQADVGEERLRVEVVSDYTAAFGFEIYAYNGTDLVIPPMAWTNGTVIETNVPEPGFYYVKVFGTNLGYEYDLWWDDFSSSEDYYEPNNFYWEAYQIPSSSWLPFGPGVQGNDDWYKISLGPKEEQLYVDLTFTHELGNIDLEIWALNASGFTQLAGNYSLDDDEYIELNWTLNRELWILVFGENKSNSYDLWWAPKGMDDYYEEND